MKITVLGARGNVGSRVVAEAIARGHVVTAVVRRAGQLAELPEGALPRVGDAASSDEVAALGRDADLVINATRPPAGDEEGTASMTRALLDGMAATEARLIVVGGAATLQLPGQGGRMLLDDPVWLPAEYRPSGLASASQHEVIRADSRVDWTYLSPPAELGPGARLGRYRVGRDELLVDDDGRSRISVEDLAVAILDEAERPSRSRERFTVAY